MRPFYVCLATVSVGLAGCGSAATKTDADVSQEIPDSGTLQRFSFFVTSVRVLQDLSGDPHGFGGDLRFGETGLGAGLRGADKICTTIAERSKPGSSTKQWRAFLSATDDGTGKVVHAIERIGAGPWYDRLERLFAPSVASLLGNRPQGGDATIVDDFPNEDGVPNHRPDPTMGAVDNHDMLTGTDARGQLHSATSTCLDWTSKAGDVASEGRPRVGHSWPRVVDSTGSGDASPPCAADAGTLCLDDGGLPPFGDGGFPSFGDGGIPPFGDGGFPLPDDGGFVPDGAPDGGLPTGTAGIGDVNNWMSALDESGCAPGINLLETGPPLETSNTVGSGGGYGGFYCFALTP